MKVFNDETPKVPVSAFQHLGAEGSKFRFDDLLMQPTVVENMLNVRKEIRVPPTEPMASESCAFSDIPPQTFSLMPLFEQPSASSNFTEIVKGKNICLETVRTDSNGCIFGLVRVANLAFHKLVTVVWTKDAWKTVTEQPAKYVAGSSEGGMDQFSFLLECGELRGDTEVELCLRFSCQGDHWDNNMRRNYIFHAMPTTADEDKKLYL